MKSVIFPILLVFALVAVPFSAQAQFSFSFDTLNYGSNPDHPFAGGPELESDSDQSHDVAIGGGVTLNISWDWPNSTSGHPPARYDIVVDDRYINPGPDGVVETADDLGTTLRLQNGSLTETGGGGSNNGIYTFTFSEPVYLHGWDASGLDYGGNATNFAAEHMKVSAFEDVAQTTLVAADSIENKAWDETAEAETNVVGALIDDSVTDGDGYHTVATRSGGRYEGMFRFEFTSTPVRVIVMEFYATNGAPAEYRQAANTMDDSDGLLVDLSQSYTPDSDDSDADNAALDTSTNIHTSGRSAAFGIVDFTPLCEEHVYDGSFEDNSGATFVDDQFGTDVDGADFGGSGTFADGSSMFVSSGTGVVVRSDGATDHSQDGDDYFLYIRNGDDACLELNTPDFEAGCTYELCFWAASWDDDGTAALGAGVAVDTSAAGFSQRVFGGPSGYALDGYLYWYNDTGGSTVPAAQGNSGAFYPADYHDAGIPDIDNGVFGDLTASNTLNWQKVCVRFVAESADQKLFISKLGGSDAPAPYEDGGLAIDNITLVKALCDHGDLPDAGPGTGAGDYESLTDSGGPRHMIVDGLFLGASVDAETDALVTPDADGDDIPPTSETTVSDDEDGLTFPSVLCAAGTHEIPLSVTNTTGATAHLEGWIDWNGDGEFDPTEMVVDIDDSSAPFPATLSISVPADAITTYDIGARFRLGDSNDMTPLGDAAAGEVEDYMLEVKPPLGVGNLVFVDTNGDGDYDAGVDGAAPNVTVELYATGDTPGIDPPIDSTTTDSSGCYELLAAPGSYFVYIPAAEFAGGDLDGLVSITGSGGDDGIDDDGGENGLDAVDPASTGVRSADIMLSAGGEPLDAAESGKDGAGESGADADMDYTIDFGFEVPTGTFGLGNLVFRDDDNDGIFDAGAGDTGVDGVTIELYDLSAGPGAVATTVTAGGGCYYFGGLAPGDYIVRIPPSEFATSGALAGFTSIPGSGDDDGLDDSIGENGVDPVTDEATDGVASVVVSLAAGTEPVSTGGPATEIGKDAASDDGADADNDLTIDFGFLPPVGVGNLVFSDANSNGVYEPGSGESGIDGVTVELYKDGDTPGVDTPVAITITAGGGCYYFGDLPIGHYVVYIPGSNFATASDPLFGLMSSTGATGDDNQDDDSNHENGIDVVNPAASGVQTAVIELDNNTEPVETGKDATADDADDDNSDLTVDFGFAPAGLGIGNLVFADGDGDGVFDPSAGETGIENVLVELWTQFSPPATGPGPIAVTVTDADGCYYFGALQPAGYIVHIPGNQFAAGGPLEEALSSIGAGGDDGVDDDGGENGTDNATPVSGGVSSSVIALAAGTEPVDAGSETGKAASADSADGDVDLTVDFGFYIPKAGTFADWQTENPLGGLNGPGDNPDGDIYSNALEYALCLHPDEGTGDTVPGGGGGFCADLNATTGTVDAFFNRALGGLGDVTYTLQSASVPGNPTTWTDETSLTPVVTNNGDGTEEVRFTDLQTNISSAGLVRLKVEVTGDATGPHYTQVFGWDTTEFAGGCQTYSSARAAKGIYSGTAANGDYSGGLLNVSSAGGDFGAQLQSGKEYYLEFISGIYEGHRFDVNEGTSTSFEVGIDTTSGHNTLDSVPADLQGRYEVRCHLTFDDLADPALAVPTNDSATGDRILIFNGSSWDTYWVTDIGGAVPPQWTDATDGTLSNAGGTVIDPCEGFFLHPKGGTISATKVGVVRAWDFACPLKLGYNLVGGGYPMAMSFDDRAMHRDDGDGIQDWFNGSNDPTTADQVLTWLGDATVGAQGYESYFRLYLGLPGVYDHWTEQGSSGLADEDMTKIFEPCRAVFINSRDGHDKGDPDDVWVWPAPWAP